MNTTFNNTLNLHFYLNHSLLCQQTKCTYLYVHFVIDKNKLHTCFFLITTTKFQGSMLLISLLNGRVYGPIIRPKISTIRSIFLNVELIS